MRLDVTFYACCFAPRSLMYFVVAVTGAGFFVYCACPTAVIWRSYLERACSIRPQPTNDCPGCTSCSTCFRQVFKLRAVEGALFTGSVRYDCRGLSATGCDVFCRLPCSTIPRVLRRTGKWCSSFVPYACSTPVSCSPYLEHACISVP